MTRAEHLARAKERALAAGATTPDAYLDIGDTFSAVASMVSDMRKHKGSDEIGDDALAEHPGLEPVFVLSLTMVSTEREVRNWIEGFR